MPCGVEGGRLEIVESDLANVAAFVPARRDMDVVSRGMSKREPGIKFRAVCETLRDAADWFRTQGMITARPNRAEHTLQVLELS